MGSLLISFGQGDAVLGRFPADQAFSGWLLLGIKRANGHAAGFFFDPRLAFGAAAPGRPHKAAAVLEVRDDLRQRGELERVGALIFERAIEKLLLKSHKLLREPRSDPGDGDADALAREAVDQFDLTGVGVACADVKPNWNALELPVRVLVAGPVVAPVDAMADAGGFEDAAPSLDA